MALIDCAKTTAIRYEKHFLFGAAHVSGTYHVLPFSNRCSLDLFYLSGRMMYVA